MDSPSQYQPQFDELIAFASAEPRKEDLLAAKAEYFKLTGEVFEDDQMFELRMASFLDYYLFDRKSPLTGKTPAEELLEQKHAGADGPLYRPFTETVHGLFEVRKIGKGVVRLRELFSEKDFEVTERRQMVGLEKGDILEARLIPHSGHLLFSHAFCYHPRVAAKAIKKEVKRRKKHEPNRAARELTWEAARRAVKVERYKQVPVERIYDFTQSKL
jgi:hypothetical protein